jgi:hypothetical protein
MVDPPWSFPKGTRVKGTNSAGKTHNKNRIMKLKTLLTGLAAVAACSTNTLRADVLKTVTVTMTAYTQNTNNDNGTVDTTANPLVKTYNTQAILNLLAQDKLAEGQWGSSVFPAGSKLAATNDAWVVVDSANTVMADVSDILSGSGGGNEVLSGKQNDTTQLASPTLNTMEVVKITFDDTAIAGGNNISFYLQGLSTKTVTDTTPTSAGVYTETQTGKITGAAGEGTWSNSTPFVCSGNMTTTAKATFGQTSIPGGFAPASLAGYAATLKFGGKSTIAITWGDATWGQTGTGSDTNADDYCAGSYAYVKTGPNTAHMTSSDIGMLSWLGTTNVTDVDVTFTSASGGSLTFWSENDSGTGPMTLSHVSNLVPATLAGRTIQFYKTPGVVEVTMNFTNDVSFTETKAGIVTGYGTYTLTQYSPTAAIIQQNYTDPGDSGAVSYAEVVFTSATAGRAFHSFYQSPVYGSNPDDSGLGTFKVQ